MVGMSNLSDPADSDDVNYDKIPKHVWKYAKDQDDLVAAARDIRRYLGELAELASIPIYTIEARAKSLHSYQEKAKKKNSDGLPEYSDPVSQIHDCVAARVIVFTTRARNDLADLIASHAKVLERKNPGTTKYNGYDSEHVVIANLTNRDALARHVALGRYFAKYSGLEIQIRSVAGHAWAEYEHDVRYKSGAYQELSKDGKSQIDQWFVEAGGMRRVMDDLFGMIEERLNTVAEGEAVEPRLGEQDDELDEQSVEDSNPLALDQDTLGALIQSRFPDHELGDSSAIKELLEHLAVLDVLTIGKLEQDLANVAVGRVARLMSYPSETSGVRRLDDELLAIFTENYVETAVGEERKQFLRLRLRRVRGKFAIYSVDDRSSASRRLITAAKAVREVARVVANFEGIEAVNIDNAVATDEQRLLPSTNAVMVNTKYGPIFVATNFTRSWAESVMRELVSRTPGSSLRIYRAGDLLAEAPTLEANNQENDDKVSEFPD